VMTDHDDILSEARVLQAFRLIAERVEAGAPSAPLVALSERLAGELLGDAQRVAATLAPDFVLEAHTGGPTTTLAAKDMVAGIGRQGEAGVMLWTELDDLMVEPRVVGGSGLLHTFRPDPGSVTSFPFAFFIHYADRLMTSEVAFMEVSAGVNIQLAVSAMPNVKGLESLLSR
jgi:hypothetical protein